MKISALKIHQVQNKTVQKAYSNNSKPQFDVFELSMKGSKKPKKYGAFEKIKIAKQAFGADIYFPFKVLRLENDEVANVEEYIKRDVWAGHIVDYLELNKAETKRALELLDLGILHDKIVCCAQFDEENESEEDYKKRFEKILEIAKRGINDDDFFITHSRLEDKRFDKFLEQIDSGVDFDAALSIALIEEDEAYLRCFDLINDGYNPLAVAEISYIALEDRYKNALEYLKMGIDEKTALRATIWTSSEKRKGVFLNYVKQGIRADEALNFAINKGAPKAFLKYKKQGYSQNTSAFLANLKTQEEFDISSVAKIYEKFENIQTNYNNPSSAMSDFISEYPDVDYKKMSDFAQKLDVEKLKNLAQREYSFEDLLYFCAYHCDKTELPLKKEDLIYRHDLTEISKEKLLNAQTLDRLLAALPLTDRNIGDLPQDWGKDKNAKEKVFDVLASFSKNKDKKQFCKNLSELLNKKVRVIELESGMFGRGYAILVDGAKPCCLKLFKKMCEEDKMSNHGAHFEPQTAIFANEHSQKFVKMFFGRVANSQQEDSFMVTQFLQEGTGPIKTCYGKKYTIENDDYGRTSNMINNKIIDFGGTKVENDLTWKFGDLCKLK